MTHPPLPFFSKKTTPPAQLRICLAILPHLPYRHYTAHHKLPQDFTGGALSQSALTTLQAWVQQATRIVFFGGAGVSTESGIPDFRGVDGLYRQKYAYPPETILSDQFFYSHTEEFYAFIAKKCSSPTHTQRRA